MNALVRSSIVLLFAATLFTPLQGQASSGMAAKPLYVLLEPVPGKNFKEQPLMRPLSDRTTRPHLDQILHRPFMQWVLKMGVLARQRARAHCRDSREICAGRFDYPAYFVIKPRGNRPRQGLAIQGEHGPLAHPRRWYVEIDAGEAESLIPHEYGHVMMFLSLPGDVPKHPRILPHTTGAITNDITALSEGWGIHLEALAAERPENAALYSKRHREQFVTRGDFTRGDSLLPVNDLLNYAQDYRRFSCIRDNCFAYLPRVPERIHTNNAVDVGDILARWTDTTYDPARLRSLEQMAASEGLIATLFFRLATYGQDGPEATLPSSERYRGFFDAFAGLTEKALDGEPAVLLFLENYLKSLPGEERREAARAALEVFHYTPLIPQAPQIYAELEEMGHLVQVRAARQREQEVAVQMKAAVERLAADPELLASAAAPEIWIVNRSFLLSLPVFGFRNLPLAFDLNTAPLEFLMTVPGVDFEQARLIVQYRRRHGGFRRLDDLKQVKGLQAAVISAFEKEAKQESAEESRKSQS